LPVKDLDRVIDRVVDGEALLIHLPSGEYFSLDRVGTSIWENIDGAKTVRDLAELVFAEYDVDRDQAVADVLRLVEQLADEGLLVS
jgi:hypothetical protein